MLFVSSGLPSSDNKYRSPYITRYLEAVEPYYNVIHIFPKSAGTLGILQTNIQILYLIITGQVNRQTTCFFHSILHAIVTILLNCEKTFVNFHGVEVFDASRKIIRLPINFYLRKKSKNISAIFPSLYMSNAVKKTYSCSFKKDLVNYSLGIDLKSRRVKIIANHKAIKVLYPGNTTYLKGFDTFEDCVRLNSEISFYCFPIVYERLSGYENVFLQEEYAFNLRHDVLKKYDVLLQLSRFESLSLVVLESYLQNVLCVVRELPVMNELKMEMPNLKFFTGALDLNELVTHNVGLENSFKSGCLDESLCVDQTLKFLLND